MGELWISGSGTSEMAFPDPLGHRRKAGVCRMPSGFFCSLTHSDSDLQFSSGANVPLSQLAALRTDMRGNAEPHGGILSCQDSQQHLGICFWR